MASRIRVSAGSGRGFTAGLPDSFGGKTLRPARCPADPYQRQRLLWVEGLVCAEAAFMAIPIRRQTPPPSSGPQGMGADHPVRHSWIRSHAPNIGLGLLRVVAGFMLMEHGAQKLFGWLPMPGMPPFSG